MSSCSHPNAVRRYVPRNETDRADAKGLLEAFRNQEICPVPVKSVAQQTLAALHRLRSAWLASRTVRINTLRGLLRKFGVTIPAGACRVVPHVQALPTSGGAPVPAPLQPTPVAVVGDVQRFPSGRHFAASSA